MNLVNFLLHSEKNKIFIDKKYSVYWRGGNSSSGEHLDEIQANQFAAALLMTKYKLFEELSELDFDEADQDEGEEAITILARKFDVSTQAMSFRLLRLGLLK